MLYTALAFPSRPEDAAKLSQVLLLEDNATWPMLWTEALPQSTGMEGLDTGAEKDDNTELVAHNRFIRQHPFKVSQIHYDLGIRYARHGALDLAIQEFKTAIRYNSQSSACHYQLGDACFKAGRYDEAICALQAAIRIQPAYAEAHIKLGMVLGHAGLWQEAMRTLKTGIVYCNTPVIAATAYHYLGKIHAQQGQYAIAMEEIRVALRLDPALGMAYYDLALLYSQLDEEGLAMQAFGEAMQLEPYVMQIYSQWMAETQATAATTNWEQPAEAA